MARASRTAEPHKAAVYFDAAANLAVHSTDQQVAWSRDGWAVTAHALGLGRTSRSSSRGDDLRIDWGYLYRGDRSERRGRTPACADAVRADAFVEDGGRSPRDDDRQPRRADDQAPRWPSPCT